MEYYHPIAYLKKTYENQITIAQHTKNRYAAIALAKIFIAHTPFCTVPTNLAKCVCHALTLRCAMR